jgi:hypothetical protein
MVAAKKHKMIKENKSKKDESNYREKEKVKWHLTSKSTRPREDAVKIDLL